MRMAVDGLERRTPRLEVVLLACAFGVSACSGQLHTDGTMEDMPSRDASGDGSNGPDRRVPDGTTGLEAGPGSDGSLLDAAADGAGSDEGLFEDARPETMPEPASDGSDGAPPCPVGRGPAMVSIVGPDGHVFCIDATEVTNAQYAAFLAAGDVGPQPSVCDANESYVPLQNWPPDPDEDDYPVNWVDWCDAQAFCAWAGKRLCGRFGGGALTPEETTNPSASSWYFACSNDGKQEVPYGTSADGSCNSQGSNGAVERAGATKACAGAFPGLFDMVGNLAEWTDACAIIDGDDRCYLQGGSYADSNESCKTTYTWVRTETDYDYGIRCCAP
jgi:sulfatase modifying factor 1